MSATPEQLRTYLTERGWRPPAPDTRTPWRTPDGRIAEFTSLAWKGSADYDRILSSIGRHEGRSVLEVMLTVEGHRPMGDLTALDAAIETWWRASEGPYGYTEIAGRDPSDYRLHRADPDQRRDILDRIRTELDHVMGQLEAAPSVAAAAAQRPRREVWEAELRGQPWFDRWPTAMRARIVEAIVDTEHTFVLDAFDEHFDRLRDRLPEWDWHPETGQMHQRRGKPGPLPGPDIDAILTKIGAQLPLRQIEARVALDWVAKVPERQTYPAPIQRAAAAFWYRHGAEADSAGAWTDSGLAEPLASRILALARAAFPPGGAEPTLRAPSAVGLGAADPHIDIGAGLVAEAFPDNPAAPHDPGPEPETHPHSTGVEADEARPRGRSR